MAFLDGVKDLYKWISIHEDRVVAMLDEYRNEDIPWTGTHTFSDAVAAIRIGACATGIDFTGALATGIAFHNATLLPNAGRTNIAIEVGSRANPLTVTMLNANSQNFNPVQICANIVGANPSSTSSVSLIRISSTHSALAMSNLRLRHINSYMYIEKDLQDAYVYTGGMDFYTNAIAVGGEAAVMNLNMECNSAVTGKVRGLIINVYGNGLPATSIGAEVRVDGSSAATLGEGIRVWTVGGNTITTGLAIRGNVTQGIDFADVSYEPESTKSNFAIGIGDRNDVLVVNMHNAASQHFEPIQINMDFKAPDGAPTSTSTVNMIYAKLNHDTVEMPHLRLKCADWTINVAKNIKDAYVLQTELDIVGNRTIAGEASAGAFQLNVGAGPISVSSRLSALIAVVVGAAAVTGNYYVADFGGFTNAALDSIIRLNTSASASATSGILMEIDGTVTYAIDFQGSVSDAWTTGDETGSDELGAFDQYVKIPIRVKGVTPTLYLMAAETWKAVTT